MNRVACTLDAVFFAAMTCGVAGVSMTRFLSVPGLFAQELMLTATQGEGPFYPDHLPLDTDNDLLIVNDSLTPAVGDITHLSGRILDARGDPIRNVLVEIWQVTAMGSTCTPTAITPPGGTRISRGSAVS